VGSTNLNIASWIGNYELDVAIEDEGFAEAMETMYQEDLSNSTEIVLTTGRKVRPEGKRKSGSLWTGRRRGGSSTRAAAGALRLANSIGAAMTNRRVLGATEARIMSFTGIVLLLLALICWSWPWLVSFPLAGILIWISLTLFVRSWRLRKERRKS
jgi:cardiolipin synthase